MAILNPKELKYQANQKLACAGGDPRRLVLIYTGVIAALTLGSSGLDLFLDSQIGATGGLSGLGTRSVLQTIQEILDYVNIFFGPFWSAGFLYAMIGLARDRTPTPGDLMAGFRRFGRILACIAVRFLLILVLISGIINLAGILFSFTPWAAAFAEALSGVMSDPNFITAEGAINLSLIPQEAFLAAAIPLICIFLAFFVPVYAYLSYCFRMAMYLVMELGLGAVRAHIVSAQMMRGHKWQMLKLDLSYWWYYALSLLIGFVGYLDVILSLAGITLPVSATVMFFLTLILYCGLQLVLYLWKKCQVDLTYVLAFQSIAHPDPAEALAEME